MTDLVSAAEMVDFPGAPYPADVLSAAGETVRKLCGWHIAASKTDTVTLDSDGGRFLWLPSLQVTAVTEVRDVVADTVIADVEFLPNGRLYLSTGRFPCGYAAVRVEFTHGYPVCPTELLPVVASFCQSASTDSQVLQQTLGSWSQTYRDAASVTHDPQGVLDTYSVNWGIG